MTIPALLTEMIVWLRRLSLSIWEVTSTLTSDRTTPEHHKNKRQENNSCQAAAAAHPPSQPRKPHPTRMCFPRYLFQKKPHYINNRKICPFPPNSLGSTRMTISTSSLVWSQRSFGLLSTPPGGVGPRPAPLLLFPTAAIALAAAAAPAPLPPDGMPLGAPRPLIGTAPGGGA